MAAKVETVRCRAISRSIRNKDNSELLRDDDGIPFVVDRIKACGNAVVPGVAKYLFECIKGQEKKLLKTKTESGIETVNSACQ
jgi:hypothetical protein